MHYFGHQTPHYLLLFDDLLVLSITLFVVLLGDLLNNVIVHSHLKLVEVDFLQEVAKSCFEFFDFLIQFIVLFELILSCFCLILGQLSHNIFIHLMNDVTSCIFKFLPVCCFDCFVEFDQPLVNAETLQYFLDLILNLCEILLCCEIIPHTLELCLQL